MKQSMQWQSLAWMTGGCLFFSGAAVWAGPLFDPPEEAIPWTIDVGSTKQLFLDDRLIADAQNISAVMTRPKQYAENPVIRADRPWEQGTYGGFTGINLPPRFALYDEEEKLFKIWYAAGLWEQEGQEGKKIIQPWCYAVSRDGYHWEKPNLGLVEFAGSRENNILLLMEDETFWSVIKTPHDSDPKRLYKAFGEIEPKGRMEKHGACVAFSPDGIRWTSYEGNPVIKKGPDFADGSSILGWDCRINKYVAYLRASRPSTRPMGKHLVRSVGYAASDDFIHWSPSQLMLVPNEKDRVDTEYEMFSGSYDPKTGFYLGLMHMRQSTGFEAYLLSSRDGFRWTWIDRHRPLIGIEETEGGIHNGILPSGPIFHDGKVWLYYQESRSRFDDQNGEALYSQTANLAILPRDRYVGLIGGIHMGRLTTRALTFEGTTLMIDVEGAFPGQHDKRGNPEAALVRVGLLNHRGEPIRGFTLSDCQPIETSGFQPVRWSGGSLETIPKEKAWYTKDIHNWPDIQRRVQICFELCNAALYSFQFQP